jgi:hypothetical protein
VLKLLLLGKPIPSIAGERLSHGEPAPA